MLPQLGLIAIGALALHRSRRRAFGNAASAPMLNPDFNLWKSMPNFDEAMQPGYSYFDDERFPGDHSWTNMRLSPEFHWMEKPLRPQADYSDLAVGSTGSHGFVDSMVQSDPYYDYDYVYDSTGDYYRDSTQFRQITPPWAKATNAWPDQFAGPGNTAFTTLIRNAQDKVHKFIRG